ncbi:BTAD domain-containing putative transcriptional regulator [Nocardia miyunensis]|uniref:BTAD domain-containing putative transcriptional regulator n=1 Tax=Nocardia miyunensis TaxID=282684 RepID=UPI00082B19CC|nr:BTAD domain-containing putative transcriptional regulator [Nocardia miyunensis]
MTPTTAHTVPAGSGPLLIAVTGLAPGTGVTTTALALARVWPGPEPAVLVEADPAGGQLAELVDGDPYRGLASVSWAARAGGGPVRAAEHLQTLPGDVGFLAAPPGPDPLRTAWVTMLLTGCHHDRRLDELAAWRELGATVIADCGAPGPDSALSPLLSGADACLVLVHGGLVEAYRTGEQIRELAGHARRPGVLLLGADLDSHVASAVDVPVLASVPHTPHSATALLRRNWPPQRRNRLLHAVRAIARTVDTQLRPPAPASPSAVATNPPAHTWARRRGRVRGLRRAPVQPSVYRLELPAGLRPGTIPASQAEPGPRTPPAPPTQPGPAVGTEPTGTAAPTKPVVAPRASRPVPPSASSLDAAPPPGTSASPDSASPSLPARRGEPGLAIRIFGPTRILWRGGEGADSGAAGVEITERVQPRSRELLTVLALHPKGLGRAQLLEALWGEQPPERPSHALSNLLSRLRTAIATATDASHAAALLTDERMRYRLNPATVRVDYWEFTAAVSTRRTARGERDRVAASQRIIDLATTPLATDLSRPWLDPLREAARRDALNALGWLASHTVTVDPRTTLGMLETAAETDPYNETLWQDILRLHARLGEYDALARTFSLLSKKLAEIDTTPSRETRALLDHLRNTAR